VSSCSGINTAELYPTYGVVVFSKAFLAQKKWTEYELSGLFALEELGRPRIFPIWHGITEAEIKAYSPSLSLRLAKSPMRDSYQDIVASVKRMLKKAANPTTEQARPASTSYPKREHLGPTAAEPGAPRCALRGSSVSSLRRGRAGKCGLN